MAEAFVLGWEEWVGLPDLALPAIRAKVAVGHVPQGDHCMQDADIVERDLSQGLHHRGGRSPYQQCVLFPEVVFGQKDVKLFAGYVWPRQPCRPEKSGPKQRGTGHE